LVSGNGRSAAKKTPVVILHGGPGAAHDYTDAFAAGERRARRHPVRSIGCGRSTHLRDKGRFLTPGCS
jgi:L-proline amide hydrolase